MVGLADAVVRAPEAAGRTIAATVGEWLHGNPALEKAAQRAADVEGDAGPVVQQPGKVVCAAAVHVVAVARQSARRDDDASSGDAARRRKVGEADGIVVARYDPDDEGGGDLRVDGAR
jgi:hypothetical protein